MSILSRGIGCNLAFLRSQKGMSQEELGDAVRLPVSEIDGFEQGRRVPSLECLYQMAMVLDEPISCFFKGLEFPDQSEKLDHFFLLRTYDSFDVEKRRAVQGFVERIAGR